MEEKNHMNEQQTQTVTNEDLMQVLRAINESRQHFDETIQHQVSTLDSAAI